MESKKRSYYFVRKIHFFFGFDVSFVIFFMSCITVIILYFFVLEYRKVLKENYELEAKNILRETDVQTCATTTEKPAQVTLSKKLILFLVW